MNRTLLTDLYQLTMLQAYHTNKKDDDVATFDLFIRKLPEDWGYFIANGIEDAIDYAINIQFEKHDIEYLREQNLFTEDFLDSLNNFRFTGDISAVPEGAPVTANTPLLRVTAKRSEAQLLETMLLNTVNYQTLVASKASRVVQAAGDAAVADFGLRRAHEASAGMTGARAAYIAGAVSTSNVLAGKEYGIPITGTMAHSFVMSYDSELDAFRDYVNAFPENGVLLVDTYDTLEGVRNAVTVTKELKERGGNLMGIRLDSGDLEELSKGAREILDDAGLEEVKILASNDLNEYKIAALKAAGAPIDGYGVGTEMITAKPVSAVSGVYKLVEDTGGPKIKLAPEKITYPGKKQVFRQGEYTHDVLGLDTEEGTPLLQQVVKDGKRLNARPDTASIREYSLREVAKLPEHAKRVRAKPYEMRPSQELQALVDSMRGRMEVAA